MPVKIFWKLWGIPILLGLGSLVGLISALVADGVWDVLSWLLLGALVAVVMYCWSKSTQYARREEPREDSY